MKITGRHMEVTPALRQHIRARFERLDRYDVPLVRLELILSVNKLQHIAEVACNVGGKRFQAKTSTREMYATIDQVVARLDAQIKKYKERRAEHKGRKKPSVSSPEPSAMLSQEDVKVVRPKLAVLSRLEARRQLGPSPGALLMFTCSESGKLQILQRVETGHVVLIDP